MRLYLLSKQVVSILDPGQKFFQNYTTNVWHAPKNAFVDIKGKVVATFDNLVINDTECLIVLERDYFPLLMEHLEKYLPLLEVKITPQLLHVYFDLDSKYTPTKGEYTLPQRKGQLILTSKQLKTTVEEEEFRRFRLDHHLPLQGVDYHREMLLNIGEEFVSFQKGCFLGQEVLARVHYKSKPPKKLVVRYEEECSEEEKKRLTSTVWDPKRSQRRGFVFVSTKGEKTYET
ncbi:MAG: hypothetical protein D6805_09715 [Planctomycetota bacterium]|nr:MAG: hypothetical protein D6805_09715 [Planctomycetota bacterium]